MKAQKKTGPEQVDDDKVVVFDLSQPDTGAIFWSEDNGYILSVPDGNIPMPLYALGLCFMRLCNDPEFVQDLLSWSKRKIH